MISMASDGEIAVLFGEIDGPGFANDGDLDLSRILEVLLHGLGDIL
jgi:hypothetical protein